MTKLFRFYLSVLALLCLAPAVAQECVEAVTPDYRKLSPHLRQTVSALETNSAQRKGLGGKRVMALMSFTDSRQTSDILTGYGCQVVDSIGRIFIVNIPFQNLAALSADRRVERIEAEKMPKLAMDVTPGQVNAAPVYAGEGLPQAFTGKGVAAGVFDKGYDFSHPAFLDAEGNSRIRYCYDFCWENGDGSLGRAMTSEDELAEYENSPQAASSLHGTHVMGIMAGRAVDGKYPGMAPDADLYVAHFNSFSEDFENPDEMTSAVSTLGFKYIFDQAEKDGKPCVVNFSSGESCTLEMRRVLETEALLSLTGPGRIIVVAAGNDGTRSAYCEKPEGVIQAGAAILNGVGAGNIIDLDVVTAGNQNMRFDFLTLRLMGSSIDKTLRLTTDSVLNLSDTCVLSTELSLGDVRLKVWKSDFQDERGDVFHVRADFSNPAYLLLCGALFLLSSDNPAWVYSDIQYSPFVNLTGVDAYCHALPGHSVWWPGTVPGLITVGGTGYKKAYMNIDGEMNHTFDEFGADQPGLIAHFSSQGPTFEGFTKPDVTAPGMSINAAFNGHVAISDNIRKELTDKVSFNGKTYYYTAQSGTSMASPVVAGTIALWLEANPQLTPDDILDVFAHTCTHPEPDMDYPNSTYGYGQIDAYKGLLYILDAVNAIPSLSDHQPLKANFRLDGRRLHVLSDNALPEGSTISVYTIDGRKMAAVRASSVDLSGLSAGVYAVQLNTGDVATSGSTLIRLY